LTGTCPYDILTELGIEETSEKFDPLLRDHLPKFETAWIHQDRVSIVQPANRNVFLSFKRFNISTTGL